MESDKLTEAKRLVTESSNELDYLADRLDRLMQQARCSAQVIRTNLERLEKMDGGDTSDKEFDAG